MRKTFLSAILILTVMIVSISMFACSSSSDSDEASGPSYLNAKFAVAKVGGAGSRDITLANLTVIVRSDTDTFTNVYPLDPSGQQTFFKQYDLDFALKSWELIAFTKDNKDSTIHYKDTTFMSIPGVFDINLFLFSNYSNFKSNIYPMADSCHTVNIYRNGTLLHTTTFAIGSIVGDTVKFAYDYLPALPVSVSNPIGVETTIKIDILGRMWNREYILYSGSKTFGVVSGVNAYHKIDLIFTGPPNSPSFPSITVVLGNIGTIIVDGEIIFP